MRKAIWLPIVLAVPLAVLLAALLTAAPLRSADDLLTLVPGRPLVAFHTAEFAGLASRVRELPAAGEYLKSKARDAYADSKLALKLADRAERLGTLAGMPLTLETLVDHARSEAVLALYDIGELQFLLILRLPAAEQAELAFVKNKAKFTQRVYEGRTYWSQVDYASGVGFLFYQEDDLLFVATGADLLEGALLAKAKPDASPRLVGEADFQKLPAVDPEVTHADATVFLDLKRLRDDRYFRAYWVWRNRAELAADDAALVGFSCDGRAWRERRAVLGSATAAAAPELRYDGRGLVAFQSGGEGVTAQLRSFLGWDAAALNLENTATARLLVAMPYLDPQTGLWSLHAGAVLRETTHAPAEVAGAAAADLRQTHPALAGRLQPQSAADGAVCLGTMAGMPGLCAARQGDLLFLAESDAFLRDLLARVKPGEPGPLHRATVAGGAAADLAKFLRQADDLGAISDSGSEFASTTLIDLLRSAGSFAAMSTVAVPVAGGWRQETVWQ